MVYFNNVIQEYTVPKPKKLWVIQVNYPPLTISFYMFKFYTPIRILIKKRDVCSSKETISNYVSL